MNVPIPPQFEAFAREQLLKKEWGKVSKSWFI
jgi:hypothetical protein